MKKKILMLMCILILVVGCNKADMIGKANNTLGNNTIEIKEVYVEPETYEDCIVDCYDFLNCGKDCKSNAKEYCESKCSN